MKIITWNINGIRTFRGGIKTILDSLDADIICVQETKVTRDLLDERTAIVEGYNSYFSFSRGRSGYSGVATYCKNRATPFAAEEGLTGLFNSHDGAVGCYGDQNELSEEELQLLDNEGRAVITQHKIKCQEQVQTLTVINVYCPRADPEKPERKEFKLRFYNVLQGRAEALLRDGSQVIVLGDVNTSHRPIDHCDPSDIDDFEGNPGRKWLNGFLYCDSQKAEAEESDGECADVPTTHSGKFVDTFRYFHPTRPNAFTCWSTLTGARQTNYGTRIDYIFANCEFAKTQFVGADIMPEMMGSDHCPVWARLGCSPLSSSKAPPLCTRYLPEFAGKQQKLSQFLVKMVQKSNPPSAEETLPGSQEAEERRENLNPSGTNLSAKKRTLTSGGAPPKGKKGKMAPAKPQGSLLSFFTPKCSNVVPSSETAISQSDTLNEQDVTPTQKFHSRTSDASKAPETTNMGEQRTQARAGSSQPDLKKGSSLGFWKSVLRGPPPPPSCKVHGEPCVLRTVKKDGPNMGKQFFVCARPQGHASNPDARCNYFAWVDKAK